MKKNTILTVVFGGCAAFVGTLIWALSRPKEQQICVQEKGHTLIINKDGKLERVYWVKHNGLMYILNSHNGQNEAFLHYFDVGEKYTVRTKDLGEFYSIVEVR